MSVEIKGNKITMTRGDTLRVAVGMTRDGEPYTPVEGDTVRFAMKNKRMTAGGKEFYDTEPLILKPIPIDEMILELEPNDTKPYGFGEYAYDVQITFADGTVDTFIQNSPFVLAPEVD